MTKHVILSNIHVKFFRNSSIDIKIYLLDYTFYHDFENSSKQKETYHSQKYFFFFFSKRFFKYYEIWSGYRRQYFMII